MTLPVRLRRVCALDSPLAHIALASMSAISVLSATTFSLHGARMPARKPGRLISAHVSRAMGAHHHIVAVRRRSRHTRCECSRSPPRRKTVSAMMVCRRNAPSAWRSMRSGSNWRVWSACANSIRAALSSGLDGRKSVLSTKLAEADPQWKRLLILLLSRYPSRYVSCVPFGSRFWL